MPARLVHVTRGQVSGKTTISAALARLLTCGPYVVHGFVVSETVGMDLPPPGAVEQVHPRYRRSLAGAQAHRRTGAQAHRRTGAQEKGVDAVITGNILGENLCEVIALVHATGDVHVVKLEPATETVIQQRSNATGYTHTVTRDGLGDAARHTTLGTVTRLVRRNRPQGLLANLDDGVIKRSHPSAALPR